VLSLKSAFLLHFIEGLDAGADQKFEIVFTIVGHVRVLGKSKQWTGSVH
jgi:hypothetical protein